MRFAPQKSRDNLKLTDTFFPMINERQCFQYHDTKKVILWISPESTLAEIQRFVGLMGVFGAKSDPETLRFELTPRKGLKARLLYDSNFTVVRPPPHPRFSHPTTGKRIIRLSEAINIARILQGIRPGEKLTSRMKYAFLPSKTQCNGGEIPC